MFLVYPDNKHGWSGWSPSQVFRWCNLDVTFSDEEEQSRFEYTTDIQSKLFQILLQIFVTVLSQVLGASQNVDASLKSNNLRYRVSVPSMFYLWFIFTRTENIQVCGRLCKHAQKTTKPLHSLHQQHSIQWQIYRTLHRILFIDIFRKI